MSEEREHQAMETTGPASASAPAEHGAGGADRANFLGFVAHEMRNPLSTALWSAELLARLAPSERGGARGEKLAGMCLRSLQRLRLLVEDHFLVERLDVGGLPVRSEAVRVREVVNDAIARAGVSNATVAIDAELSTPADRGLLERAIEAVVAMAARGGPAVRVEAAQTEGMAVIHVRGASPAPDALLPPRKGTASDPSGRALALYMAGHVAQALGGSLSIDGDEYVLALPFAPAGVVEADAR